MTNKTEISQNGTFSVLMSDNDLLKKASSLHLGRDLSNGESLKKIEMLIMKILCFILQLVCLLM